MSKKKISILASAILLTGVILTAVAVDYYLVHKASKPPTEGAPIWSGPSAGWGCQTDIQAKALRRQVDTTEGLNAVIQEKFREKYQRYRFTECQEDHWYWWPADEHDPACLTAEQNPQYTEYWQFLTDEMIAAAKADDDGVTRTPKGDMLITVHWTREWPPTSCELYVAEYDLWFAHQIPREIDWETGTPKQQE